MIRSKPATAEYRDNWDRMFGDKSDTPASMVPMPDGRVRYNGSGTPCDMLKGPCSCGAWHTGEEPTEALP